MTGARRLAAFLSETTVGGLPPQTLEHAAMLIASTLASAACGTNLGSARIIRDLARDGGGRADASLWFDAGAQLPAAVAAQVNAVASDAAASDDSDLRNIVHGRHATDCRIPRNRGTRRHRRRGRVARDGARL